MKYSVLAAIILTFIITGIMYQKDQQQEESKVQIVNVNEETDSEKFEVMRRTFKQRNPGYDIMYLSGVREVKPIEQTQVAFVQQIGGVTNQEVLAVATIRGNSGSSRQSEAIVGDLMILHAGEQLQFDKEMGLLVFSVPEDPGHDLPAFIRPDWDDNITDVPGGCATDIDAYRRILLTWQEEVGEYIYHAINAHRVRIYDSFSHYHPVEGGFDEFYLVQMVEPGAKIITSERVDMITNPEQIKHSDVDGLIDEYELKVGDLVYLPKGVMHRGVEGVLTQVITIPGFIPGSEIGVDHHLRDINERLSLEGEHALPYNYEHSHEPVIR